MGCTNVHTERHTRIIAVGAGASGLLLAYKLQRSFRNFSLTIFEKNPEVSGTWYENNYPGCASDLPAPNYTYTLEPQHDIFTTYACANDIRKYFFDFCRKYQLSKYIKLEQKVIGARWIDESGLWIIKVEDLQSKNASRWECNIFINASGYLNQPAFPNIPGLDRYQGTLVHSASWLKGLDLKGKQIGVLGNR